MCISASVRAPPKKVNWWAPIEKNLKQGEDKFFTNFGENGEKAFGDYVEMVKTDFWDKFGIGSKDLIKPVIGVIPYQNQTFFNQSFSQIWWTRK